MGTESQRAATGTVSIENVDGRVRFRFRHQGKRRAFYPGLPYEGEHSLVVAKSLAANLEFDLWTGNLDETLNKFC